MTKRRTNILDRFGRKIGLEHRATIWLYDLAEVVPHTVEGDEKFERFANALLDLVVLGMSEE